MNTFIEVSARPRYWQDAKVNGVEDTEGRRIPRLDGYPPLWCPVIRLCDGQVLNWPAGTVAEIHYKVCDQGQYWLLDDHLRRTAKWRGHYVPDDFLCHGAKGYGDYIILNIGADGLVQGWNPPAIHDEDWEAIALPSEPAELNPAPAGAPPPLTEPGLPQAITVDLADGRTFEVHVAEWCAKCTDPVFLLALGEEPPPDALEIRFPAALVSGEQPAAVVTVVWPEGDSPTVQLRQLRELVLHHATAFTFTAADPMVGDFHMELDDRGCDAWALRRAPRRCLSRDGSWDFEPMNSYRDDDWLAEHHWTFAEGLGEVLRLSAKETDHRARLALGEGVEKP